MSTGIPTEVGALLDGIAKAKGAEVVGVGDGVELLAMAPGTTVQSVKKLLDEYRVTPERRKGTSVHTTLDSFVKISNRFKAANSAVFAQAGASASPSITTIFDYHPEGPEKAEEDNKARFCGHRAIYSCPLSDEWVAWTEQAGDAMDQGEFAEFVEARILDVGADEPGSLAAEMIHKIGVKLAGPAQLLELSRGLSLSVGHTIRNTANLSSGESQLVFEEKHLDKVGAPLAVPGAFVLAIPVFKLGAIWQVPVRLRYRVTGGQVRWSFDLYRADRILEKAFDEACESVAKETDLPVFRGTPEA